MPPTISARWGIRIMAGWAAVLAIVTLSRLLLISEIPQSITAAPIWLLFAAYVAFAVAFAASALAVALLLRLFEVSGDVSLQADESAAQVKNLTSDPGNTPGAAKERP